MVERAGVRIDGWDGLPRSSDSHRGIAAVGVSSGAYWGYAVLIVIATVVGGFEHEDGWGGADRGLVAGAIYGIALLLAGRERKGKASPAG